MINFIIVRPDSAGRYSATISGIPEIRVVAESQEQAIEQARERLGEWLANARIVPVAISANGSPPRQFLDPNDPVEKEFLEELARMRREDLENTLEEYGQGELAAPAADPHRSLRPAV